MIADGRPEDLMQGPFVSAATFMDIVDTPPEFKDFFGVQTPNPGVIRIRCPLLVVISMGRRNTQLEATLH